MSHNKQRSFLIILTLFVLSVLIRVPNLNRPLSKHHEFNAAMVLNVCNSWGIKGGPSAYNYTPVVFYGNETDKTYLNNVGVVNGKFYYVSMGPTQFLLPYYFFKVMNLEPNPLNLQIFALFIHLLVVLLFYKLSLEYFGADAGDNKPIISTAIFMFLQNFLWFFSNAYSHESLVLLFFLVTAIYFIRVFNSKPFKITDIVVIAFTFICGIATDWLFIFVVAFFLFYNVYHQKKIKNWYSITMILIIASLISMILIFIAYRKEIGQEELLKIFKEKFFSRTISGSSNQYSWTKIALSICKNFLISYGFFTVIILIYWREVKKIHETQKRILKYQGIPALLYSIVFMQFTAENDYAMLKFGLFFVLLFSVLVFNLKNKKLSNSYFLLAILIQLGLYYYINRPGKTSFSGEKYGTIMEQGEFINSNSTPNEAIVCSFDTYNYAALMFYAKRNIAFFKTEEEAFNYQKTNKFARVKFFYFDDNNQLTSKLLLNN